MFMCLSLLLMEDVCNHLGQFWADGASCDASLHPL